jgi:A/G-specific adenine glycosylase
VEDRLIAVICVTGAPPRVVLHKRANNGLLADLWELPNVLVDDEQRLIPHEIAPLCSFVEELTSAKHVFSHIEWRMRGRLYRMSNSLLPDGYRAVTLEQLRQGYALPTAFRQYAALLPQLLQREEL